MSKIEVNQIDTISGSSTLLIGPSAATKLTFSSTLTVDFNVNSPGVTLGADMKNSPLFYAYITGTQSLSNASETKVQLETELFDTNNCFDSSTNYRFTPNLAGYYMLVGSLQINSPSDFDGWQVNIYKNGSEIAHMNGRSEYYNVHKNQIIAYANGSSDYFELYARQDSGGSLNINPGQIRSYFFGYKLIGA